MLRSCSVLQIGPVDAKGGIASVIRAIQPHLSGHFRSLTAHTSDFLEGDLPTSARHAVAAMAKAYRIVREHRDQSSPILFHIHVSSGASLLRKAVFALLARLYRIPFILHCHSAALLRCRTVRDRLLLAVLRWLLRSASRVVVPLEHWRERFLESFPFLEEEALHVIHNPVILPEYTRRTVDRPSARRIGFYGSLIESKGVHTLIRAFGEVAEKEPLVELMLAGVCRPAEKKVLAQLIAENGGDEKITVLEWLDIEERDNFLGKLDIFVLVSESEWFGLSAAEAFASGCTVIASDLPSLREVLGDHDAVQYIDHRIAPGDLARVLSAVIDDPPQGSGEEIVRNQVEGFRAEVVAGMFVQLYGEILRETATIQVEGDR